MIKVFRLMAGTWFQLFHRAGLQPSAYTSILVRAGPAAPSSLEGKGLMASRFMKQHESLLFLKALVYNLLFRKLVAKMSLNQLEI